jgi:Tol biopolymer transport system component
MDLQTKETSYLTRDFDYSVSNVVWNANSDMVYFIAGVEATYQIYRLSLQESKPVAITHGWTTTKRLPLPVISL